MAKAKRLDSPTYTLELSHEEAQTLRDLIGRHVAGGSTHSRKKYAENIRKALEEAGVGPGPSDTNLVIVNFTDTI